MRQVKPWGLAADWLEPGKVVTDPVHGDIHLMKLEVAVVDSPAMQRLRRVKQLGATQFVYPGATHTRFSHCLGTLKVAQDLMDTVLDQRSGSDPEQDLFAQWEADLGVRDAGGRYELDAVGAQEFDRKVAEATILARLGGLLHDMCHVPFGHSIEDDLGILPPHDENLQRFNRLWRDLTPEVRGVISPELKANLRRLILSKAEAPGPPAYPFVDDIVGNTICADLLDYLRRDHMFTGLPLALGRRFEAGFYVLPKGDPDIGERMILRIHRKGQERLDAITELLKHLRYRYELSERVLVHHTKLAVDSMIGKALEIWYDALWVEAASDLLAANGNDSWPAGREIDQVREAVGGTENRLSDLTKRVLRELDSELTARGDEGLIEYLRDLPTARRPGVRHRDLARRSAAAELAQDVERRALYKRIAIQRHTRSPRDEFYDAHGGASRRRELERRAARFAGVDSAWHILVWLPSPKMRLKVAGVLVDDRAEIRRFVDREEDGKGRGTDIYAAHQNLWAVSVYAHPDLVGDDRSVREYVLASLAADMNLLLGGLEGRLGLHPYEWPERIALEQLDAELDFDELIHRRQVAVAARGDDQTERPPLSALVQEFAEYLD